MTPADTPSEKHLNRSYSLHLQGRVAGELDLEKRCFASQLQKNPQTAEGAESLLYPTILSQQLPSAPVMWLTDSPGELFPSPTVMAVSGRRGDGVNTTAATSWFFSLFLSLSLVASCWTVPAVIRDIANIPQAAVLSDDGRPRRWSVGSA